MPNIKSWLQRSISGIVYCGLIIGCIFWGVYPFSFMAMLFGILAVVELEKICQGISSSSLPVVLLDCMGVSFLCFSWLFYPLLGWLCVFLCRFILELYLKNDRPIRCLSISMLTQVYIGIPLALMTLLGESLGLHFVLVVFLMIWINDTGAFVVGSLFGRHRLFERISPKKSWEGFIGGLGFNLIAAWLFCIGGGDFWDVHWGIIEWLILAAVVTIFSTWGDLVESLIKRSLCIKDSGHLIPGHGGILDRIDSLLLVMPAVFLLVFAITAFRIMDFIYAFQ